MADNQKSRGWLTIVYPESCSNDWRDGILAYMGMQAVISPLHDKDETAVGEEKKPHYHVLLLWDGPTTKKNAERIVTMIGGVGCIRCISVRGSVRYFCHLDNPEKYQYDPSDLKQIGGLDIQKLLLSESDENIMLSDMFDFIDKNQIISFKGFVDYCRFNNESWFNLLMHKHRENVWKYLRSYEYEVKGYISYEEENDRCTVESE